MRLLGRIARRAWLCPGVLLLTWMLPLPAVQIAQAAPHSSKIAYITDFGGGIEDANGTNGGFSEPGSSILTNTITGTPPVSGNYTTASGTAAHFRALQRSPGSIR